MTGALLILMFTAVVGLLLYLADRRTRRSLEENDRVTAPMPETEPASDECCGLHLVCEKDSLLVSTTEVEYFDDEELDQFTGRSPDSYSNEETALFSDILLTMRPSETAAWARSLQLRGIALPPGVRDELLLIVSEQRLQNKS